MKHAVAVLAVWSSSAAFVACSQSPVDQSTDLRLTISPDSVVVGVFASSPLNATGGVAQYVSRDQGIATVNASGVVSGVAVGATYIVATLLGHSDVRDSVRVRVHADSCSGARPDLGGAATSADRGLFAYDINAPLNLQKTFESMINGVEVSRISYSSPDGGLVTGLMWDPVTRSSMRPGIVLMHGHPGNARGMTASAQTYAEYGAVVVAIDAPFARRAGGTMTLLPQDAFEQIQAIKDLQRAVDVLRSRPNVDVDRIAFEGRSWGGATGALFVGIERRLKAAALVVGHPGQVTHATGPDGFKNISGLPCAMRVAWYRAMAPIEPIRFVANANVPLLLQNGRYDEYIPVYEAEELHTAAPSPKTVLWYDTGHSLGQVAAMDRLNWLRGHIGLDATPGS